MQLTHYDSKFSKRTFPITLVCDGITNSLNIGGIFRLADAFGIEKVILCGEQISIDNKVKRTSRSTEKVVSHIISDNIIDVLKDLKKSSHQLVALEITHESKPVFQHDFDLNTPIVLVVGAENFGISETALDLISVKLHIEMFGQNSSMNVVNATGIALYEITKQIL